MGTTEEIGRRVLAGLEKGRARAIRRAQERAAGLRALVVDLAHADALAGRSERGRAGRIARKLDGISERHVRRILVTFYSVSG